jgi:hypothetical protein
VEFHPGTRHIIIPSRTEEAGAMKKQWTAEVTRRYMGEKETFTVTRFAPEDWTAEKVIETIREECRIYGCIVTIGQVNEVRR